jgi:hypothetical protein
MERLDVSSPSGGFSVTEVVGVPCVFVLRGSLKMDMEAIRGIGKKVPHVYTGPGPDDPTPEEIREMCLEIQKEWGVATRRSRRLVERPLDMGLVHRMNLD